MRPRGRRVPDGIEHPAALNDVLGAYTRYLMSAEKVGKAKIVALT
jgi:hypothetical protein